ncbi:Aspartyl/glutamyl-tRNA(Asn/Gln) amidotransferase subunit B [Candidatus Xiphinematobacter sp. Idaho Grape]|uniref:Asp-tRNA(Asn)/Glu-tRNA(Gln) amidotransferase subunit GatB n=1 Tax=Candidatus Xiphinematobacter sp. Idaho Grape TaxID=1704307 RepID=UPI00070694F4|nr:Asp-tRNA(Asn)/Glu-tRNA(Gln) amidotransferase subunit GatB [Candidatus Xiphinematobacter sp. Idaho Grape]ALJ56361.1 Aspartyl/glutamyl-tRNA(Asn/Gln) amidotransferase subunit B [Candidatus Xiphinematobacter sp. Idaho Grape]
MPFPYIATIGLEVHVQLKTCSKMFCSCPVRFGAEPNTNLCSVCLGLPGALPVMNEEALRMAVLTGLMFGCTIAPICRFDRKNYFYPDSSKNYQISQYTQPFCRGGSVLLHEQAYPKDVQKFVTAPNKHIRLSRIHLEEDVARSFHLETSTGIDFNRSGTPLLEIVSEPDITSPEEAFACLTALKQVLLYGNVSSADMEKGQLRCDINVSLCHENSGVFGTKVEIKNLNSISGVRRALAFEIRRQTEILASGGILQQETRRWDDVREETQLMRAKEQAHDYCYFPDPDLMPVQTTQLIEQVLHQLPELPEAKRSRFLQQYNLGSYDAGVLASDLALSRFFEEAARTVTKPKVVANWILNDFLSALSAASSKVSDCKFPPSSLAELVDLIEAGTVSSRQAKEVFAEMFESGKSPHTIVRERGLRQVSDTAVIEMLCEEIIAQNPNPVADFQAGKATALNFLKGQVIQLSKGKANPSLVGEILARKLS